jgi:beta-galactosidase
MVSLAFGLRGFNLYMAVERDRWVGAPLDATGRPRPEADHWRALLVALEQTEFHRLRRAVPVLLVVPRVIRQLQRMTHALDALTPSAIRVVARGPVDACTEDDPWGRACIEVERWIASVESVLLERGVPFAHCSEFVRQPEVCQLVACVGAWPRDLALRVEEAARNGDPILLGPASPKVDESFEAMHVELRATDCAELSRALDELLTLRSLSGFPVEPRALWATVHEDESGVCRVVFVINPTNLDEHATVSGISDGHYRDALNGASVRATDGVLQLSVAARSVRMLQAEVPC